MVDNFSFIDETLSGSAYPNQIEDLDRYIDEDISHIISLTPNLPLVSRYLEDKNIIFHHFPVYATPDEAQLSQFESLMKLVVKKGEKAVVHCQYGQERTGIFLAHYLIKVKSMKVKDAIHLIRTKRPSSLQTSHSRYFILNNF